MIIRPKDVIATGFCANGMRRWFHSYGLDFHKFMREGIDAQTLLDTEDALAKRVVENTKNE